MDPNIDWFAMPKALVHYLEAHNALTDPKSMLTLITSVGIAIVTRTIKL